MSERSAALGRLERAGLGLAVVFLLALAAGFFLNRPQFYRSYLFGYLFSVLLALGSLGLAMLSHLTGGLWGVVPRRLHEAGRAHAAGAGPAVRPRALRARLALRLGRPAGRRRATRSCARRPPT